MVWEYLHSVNLFAVCSFVRCLTDLSLNFCRLVSIKVLSSSIVLIIFQNFSLIKVSTFCIQTYWSGFVWDSATIWLICFYQNSVRNCLLNNHVARHTEFQRLSNWYVRTIKIKPCFVSSFEFYFSYIKIKACIRTIFKVNFNFSTVRIWNLELFL